MFSPSNQKKVFFQDDRPGPCKWERTHTCLRKDWQLTVESSEFAPSHWELLSQYICFSIQQFNWHTLMFKLKQLALFRVTFEHTWDFMRHLFWAAAAEKLMLSQSNWEHETNRFAFWCSDFVHLLMLGLNFPKYSSLDPAEQHPSIHRLAGIFLSPYQEHSFNWQHWLTRKSYICFYLDLKKILHLHSKVLWEHLTS